MQRKQLSTAIELVISSSPSQAESVEAEILEDYEKLNEKCDKVITKIKVRKEKKNGKK
jgi:hypothetical protein